MTPELLELISTMRFPILGVVFVALIKTELINLIKGIMFRFDKDFNEGDPILLENQKARIVKIGLIQSKVYVEKDGQTTMRKFHNSDLSKLKMEKILMKHGD